MARIDELEKRYPTLPRDVIIKWDVFKHGVRDNKDIDEVSYWRPAGHGSYLSYDEDYTIERLKQETPWRFKEGYMLVPDMNIWMKSGLGFPLYRKENSPYTIRVTGTEGKFALYDGEEKVNVDLYRGPQTNFMPGLKTSKGTLAQELIMLWRRCYCIFPVRFCEYFTTGEECKFCNYNHTQEDARRSGLSRHVTINADETAEALKLYGSQLRLLEGQIESGGFAKSETEASVNVRFVDRLSNALPYRTHMKLIGEAMPRKELQRLRDSGLAGIRMAFETIDERLFPIINPGKTKHMSYQGWLEAVQDAVEIFGVGNVAAKTIGGVTMQGPEGYPTWQEARDSHVEGDRWMISHGVYPCMDSLRWAPGSPYSRDPGNRDKYPPSEFFLDCIAAHDKAMEEYGFYEKLNKFLYCGLDCQIRPYVGEVGIIKRAGDFGTWMGEVVPYEQNWMAQFLDSIKQKEMAKV
ncbi:MAG: hypothetical protein HYX94_08270 [Chloroflexi bacterium]|nr:hypothetical protein [Chloroflexota bacterium]